jgi:hypothetical protein
MFWIQEGPPGSIIFLAKLKRMCQHFLINSNWGREASFYMFWTLITYFFMTICKFSSYSHLKNKSKLKFNFFMLQESPPPKDGRGVPSHRMGARVGSSARRAPLQGIKSPLIGWTRGSEDFGPKRPSLGGLCCNLQEMEHPKMKK